MERDRLPLHYEQVLREGEEKIRSMERNLMDRDGLMRAEETRRLEAVDLLRREALNDIEQRRLRLESEMSLRRHVMSCRLV